MPEYAEQFYTLTSMNQPFIKQSLEFRSTALKTIRCLAVALFAMVSALQADIPTHLHKTTNCVTGLTWDGVVWDQVYVTVTPGYAAGLYSVRLQYYNGAGYVGYTGNINVNVAADGSYSIGNDFGWPALSGGYAYYYNTWVTNGGPNANFSVTGLG